jgi:hypothetical protein
MRMVPAVGSPMIAMLASPLAGILGASLRLAHVGAVEQMFGAVGQVRRRGCGD